MKANWWQRAFMSKKTLYELLEGKDEVIASWDEMYVKCRKIIRRQNVCLREIEKVVQDAWCDWAPDRPPHELGELLDRLEVILNDHATTSHIH